MMKKLGQSASDNEVSNMISRLDSDCMNDVQNEPSVQLIKIKKTFF